MCNTLLQSTFTLFVFHCYAHHGNFDNIEDNATHGYIVVVIELVT